MPWCWFSVYVSLFRLKQQQNERKKNENNPQNKKKMEWQSNKVYYVPEPSSLWTSCPSNLFHPHGPSLNIEAINQTLAPGYQEQCSFGPQPDRIQSDLYRPIGLFATLHAGNNRVRLTGDTWGDPLKLAMGKGSHSSSFALPRNLPVGHKGHNWKNSGQQEESE